MPLTKNIGYAYPSSPLAIELGYTKQGCYYVAVYDDSKPIERKDVVYCDINRHKVQWYIDDNLQDDIPFGKYSMSL